MDVKTRKEDQPQPGRSPIEDELTEWQKRFSDLADEAAEAGFTSAVVLIAFDPISRESYRALGYTGNFYEALAGMELTLAEWKRGE